MKSLRAVFGCAVAAGVLIGTGVAPAQAPDGSDWTTWGYDSQRTGWNKSETRLNKTNVRQLRLQWKTQLPFHVETTSLSTLTAPVVVSGVSMAEGPKNILYSVSSDDTVFAVDTDSGMIVWQKKYPNSLSPMHPATVNCANTEQATPVADKTHGVLYLTTSDGMLRGLNLGDGETRLKPVQMVAPFSRNWSLNLVGNVVYTAAGRGCGGTKEQPIEPGNLVAVDVSDLQHPTLSRFYTSTGRPAGPWGAGGPVLGPLGMYVETADGPNNPGSGIYGNSVLAVRGNAWGIKDSFVPPNWRSLNAKDLDLGSSGPVSFAIAGKNYLAAAGKEGVVYILDAQNLGGQDHSQALYTSPRLGNDEASYWGRGVWGGMTFYETPDGAHFLYVPMWGPVAQNGPKYPLTYGATPDGSILAFRINVTPEGLRLDPAWASRNLDPPAPPVVANGVVYALQAAEHTSQHPNNPEGHGRPINGRAAPTEMELGAFRATPHSTMTLFALDADTGKELWSSASAMAGNTAHFTEPVVALGKVFVVDHDGHVFAFGLRR